jgi:type I restriction enzyme S subunit
VLEISLLNVASAQNQYHLIKEKAVTRSEIESRAKSTTGVNNINSQELQSLIFNIPSLEEQKEIVRRVEERFAKIDKIEQEYQKAVKLCTRLEQATLAKAFRGELVPQDPNDEPASVLLEQIRAERQEKPKGKAAKSSNKLSHDHFNFNQTPAQ